MEGELQLKFSFRSDLYFLTFLFARGRTFKTLPGWLLFIGGAQGAFARRADMREAAKLNGEISPVTMLLIAIRELANVLSLNGVMVVAEDEQVAMGYAPERIKLNYRELWTDAGGVRDGQFYHLPSRAGEKPLSETPSTHRARTRRKRAAKQEIREAIEARIKKLLHAEPLAHDVESGG